MGREGLSSNSSFATRRTNSKREGYKKASSDPVVQLTGSGLGLFDNCVHLQQHLPLLLPGAAPHLAGQCWGKAGGAGDSVQHHCPVPSGTVLWKIDGFFKIKWRMNLLCPFQWLGHHLSHRMQGEEDRHSTPALGPWWLPTLVVLDTAVL